MTRKITRKGAPRFRNVLIILVFAGVAGLSSCGGSGNLIGSSSGSGGTSNPAPAAYKLSVSVSNLNFGSVAVGASTSQLVSFTNVGNGNVTIYSASAAGSGFSASGGANVTLAPNDAVTVSVNFVPPGAGSMTGSLSVSSNAMNSPMLVSLSGSGSAPVPHSVSLSWLPSPSAVMGYFVYRGIVSGGPYLKLNSLVDASAAFVDSTVLGGQTYFYVVTSVDTSNMESSFSNEVAVSIP